MKLRKLAIASITLVGVLGGMTTSANAVVPTYPITGHEGFDGKNDLILGGGSDTTYDVMNLITTIYNAAPGCDTNNGSGVRDNCSTTGQTPDPTAATYKFGNWDHDVTAQVYAIGSGNGINCLLTPVNCQQPVSYARSSRVLSAAEKTTSGLSQWGYGMDGLAVVQTSLLTSGRTGVAVTTAQLKEIFACSKGGVANTPYTWADLGDTGPNKADTVVPVGMNSGSGTSGTFATFLATTIATINAAPCVLRKADGVAPFENDLKQLSTDTGLQASGLYAGTSAAALYNAGRVLWWMSYGAYTTSPFQAQTASDIAVDTVAISPTSIATKSYPFYRYLYHITKTADVAPGAAYPALLGATTGQGGAVRELTRFMCQRVADTALNINNGSSLYQNMTDALTAVGFQRIPNAYRTWGLCTNADS
jgi:hypothetical protein